MTQQQIDQVVVDATTTLQDACDAAGVQSPMNQLAAVQTQLGDSQTALAAAQASATALQAQLTQAIADRDAALAAQKLAEDALAPVTAERDKLKADAKALLSAEDTLRGDVGA